MADNILGQVEILSPPTRDENNNQLHRIADALEHLGEQQMKVVAILSDERGQSTYGLMTIEEVAELLNPEITVSAVRRAITNGELKAKTIGRRYYVTNTALEEYVSCHDAPNHPVSTSDQMNNVTSFSIGESTSGRDIALQSLKVLNKP